MLTISKPLSAGQAQTYHQKEFTAKEQNYWSQRGVIAGEWQGRLAAQFGLAGAVSAEDFGKLSQGQHPETGEQLVRQRASYEYQDPDGKTVKTMEHRAGWDATFSAPKSVSLTALVGGDDRVRDPHTRPGDGRASQARCRLRASGGCGCPCRTGAPKTSGEANKFSRSGPGIFDLFPR
ncbi:relaxase domain-containing protein [Acidobacterium sp. S8]|uniref:relaxase domain-containing protein n=1 Tax=Acidobacterium sp. S8 TaxID=1641854 RepID=UPI0020B10D61|nr:relaxase domain-containing protein [Acidobacterium sp. S8]